MYSESATIVASVPSFVAAPSIAAPTTTTTTTTTTSATTAAPRAAVASTNWNAPPSASTTAYSSPFQNASAATTAAATAAPSNRFARAPAAAVAPAAPAPASSSSSLSPPLAVLSSARTPIAKLLLLISHLYKQGRLNAAQRSTLKDKAMASDAALLACIEAFEVDGDIDEILDSFNIICSSTH
jgi:hypothetical protein